MDRWNRLAFAVLLAASMPALSCDNRNRYGTPPPEFLHPPPAPVKPSVQELDGKVKLGMSEAQVKAALGPFYSGGGEPGRKMEMIYDGRDGGLAMVLINDRVADIVPIRLKPTTGAKAERRKVQAGMTKLKVLAAL